MKLNKIKKLADVRLTSRGHLHRVGKDKSKMTISNLGSAYFIYWDPNNQATV